MTPIATIGQCTFKGLELCDGRVVQFRNIKFASIPGRWEECQEIFYDHKAEYDCSQNGPICPQESLTGDEVWFGIPEEMRKQFKYTTSEFESLTLKITRPKGYENKKLPVVVFFHGGANKHGTGYNVVHDPANFVDYATLNGRPFVFVGASYRLGYLGFLPVKGNGSLGCSDLYTSLQWVNRNISNFGGDTKNITLFGESAGSMDIHAVSLHDKNLNKLVKRVIFISGLLSAMELPSMKDANLHVADFKKRLGSKDIFHADADLIGKLSAGIMLPYKDDGFFADGWDFCDLPEFESVMFLECANEGNIFKGQGKAYFTNLVNSSIGRELTTAYHITEDTVEKADAAMGDFVFLYPEYECYKALKSRSKSTYFALYDVVNPFKPEMGAHHSMPLLMLFSNYEMSKDYIDLSNKLRDQFISYFYGTSPWTPGNFIRHSLENGIEEFDEFSLPQVRNVEGLKVFSKYSVSDVYKAFNGAD